ncbi:MAG TPA: hypothetical protein VMV69_08855 [Pirellulales bacterium]|nr:hypothetical protein [Pirellulales bacterium]
MAELPTDDDLGRLSQRGLVCLVSHAVYLVRECFVSPDDLGIGHAAHTAHEFASDTTIHEADLSRRLKEASDCLDFSTKALGRSVLDENRKHAATSVLNAAKETIKTVKLVGSGKFTEATKIAEKAIRSAGDAATAGGRGQEFVDLISEATKALSTSSWEQLPGWRGDTLRWFEEPGPSA